MDTEDIKIEKWKNKLLDTGKKNMLINFRDTKVSSLRFKNPNIFEIWEKVVVKKEKIEFPYLEETVEKNEEIEAYNQIITNKTIKEQQRTLKRLRDRAKIAMEEQGINVLYLAFGFLKWKESENSDIEIESPLVLVPVSLTVASITSPYVMSLNEDEIIVNPTLRHKLNNDFGIKIEDFKEDEENLEEYLKNIEKIFSYNRWEVKYEVALSCFSFLKINMYNDLEKNRKKLKEHPVIMALMGENSKLNDNCQNLEDIDYDNEIKPIDTFQILDADSSQQEAIINAINGLSFVLQGPPGTGKSQTIANIIAECITRGKRVLFVSEKMAALDVVYKRLSNAKLKEFCLIMHSHKMNKKNILAQFDDVIKLSNKQLNIREEDFESLNNLQMNRKKLNDYSNEIFENVKPLNKTIYEINGQLAKLDKYEDVIFKIDKVLNFTQEQFTECICILRKLKGILGKSEENYKENPWYGATVKNLTYELRHDITSNVNKLIEELENYEKLHQEITSQLGTKYGKSYEELKKLIEILEIAKKSPLVPAKWIENDEDIEKLFEEAEKYSKHKENCKKIQAELKKIYHDIEDSHKILELKDLVEIKKKLEDKINDDEVYYNWNALDMKEIIEKTEELSRQINQYNQIKQVILSEFEKEILDIDFNEIYKRCKGEYKSKFRIFKKQYKIDIKPLKLYSKNNRKINYYYMFQTIMKLREMDDIKSKIENNKEEYESVLTDLFINEKTNIDKIYKEIKKFENIKKALKYCKDEIKEEEIFREEVLKKNYDYLYTGINTNWELVINALKWTEEFRKTVKETDIELEFMKNICENKEVVGKCEEYENMISVFIEKISNEFCWFINLFENKEEIKNLEISRLQDKLKNCISNLAKLEEWIDLKNVKEECVKAKLEDYMNKIDEMNIKADNIVPIFKKRFYRLWLDKILQKYSNVMNFRRNNQDEQIKEFRVLDKLQFEIAQNRIRKKLVDELIAYESSENKELAILKRELCKQRKVKPIRKLFREIPKLVLKLKPCLMMSPLTVSMFLDAETFKFDLIIFDEASQICTENAIGAILRGKQVIIAGDSKQLPPTNFFMATTVGNDDYDNEEDDEYEEEYESILEEAIPILPEKTLKWHYRSRHEDLIAFSNVKIYNNNLVTFPSNIERTKDNGVEYIYVKGGTYDRGGKNGNVVEAKKVAELVIEHLKKYPNRSLGVIAFGEIQQQAIENELRNIRINNQQFEDFFSEDKKEAFFIKNLENVQGDERDTIIFSIGYAKDVYGKMQMMFRTIK